MYTRTLHCFFVILSRPFGQIFSFAQLRPFYFSGTLRSPYISRASPTCDLSQWLHGAHTEPLRTTRQIRTNNIPCGQQRRPYPCMARPQRPSAPPAARYPPAPTPPPPMPATLGNVHVVDAVLSGAHSQRPARPESRLVPMSLRSPCLSHSLRVSCIRVHVCRVSSV